jgi:hypothetical protein
VRLLAPLSNLKRRQSRPIPHAGAIKINASLSDSRSCLAGRRPTLSSFVSFTVPTNSAPRLLCQSAAENAPSRGVVAFITNRKFLTGWLYAGLRKMLRERFDRVEIIDLRGDVRRGERAGVDSDQGVFNIMVGTAVTLGNSERQQGSRGVR